MPKEPENLWSTRLCSQVSSNQVLFDQWLVVFFQEIQISESNESFQFWSEFFDNGRFLFLQNILEEVGVPWRPGLISWVAFHQEINDFLSHQSIAVNNSKSSNCSLCLFLFARSLYVFVVHCQLLLLRIDTSEPRTSQINRRDYREWVPKRLSYVRN